jgi:hypothetical protein
LEHWLRRQAAPAQCNSPFHPLGDSTPDAAYGSCGWGTRSGGRWQPAQCNYSPSPSAAWSGWFALHGRPALGLGLRVLGVRVGTPNPKETYGLVPVHGV